jgi:2,3-bisphosphoglycerate-independent phosphoglycerate mutase
MMKYVLVIGDGMADNPVPELYNKTPLEYASIPVTDSLTSKGEFGTVKTCPDGLPAGSDTGILSIFGADPRQCYTGRSPLEAAASGIVLAPGDVSYRCNMVALEDGDLLFEKRRILSHSGGSIEGDQSDELIKHLFADPEFAALAESAGMSVYPASSFRHIAVQKGADIEGIALSPPHNYLGSEIGPILPSGNENAGALRRLMEKSYEVLNRHPINEARRREGKLPANAVWFWAEGTGVALESFFDKYKKTGAVISAVPLCHGIARLSGLDVIMVVGATGELDTNLEGKVEAALKALADGYDFVCVHVEAPDECTHNGDLKGKLQAIEWLDSRVIAPLTLALDAGEPDYRLLYLADHKTLTSTRGHDGEPVPYLIYDSRKNAGNGLAYNETDAEKGPFIDAGLKLMNRLFEQAEPANVTPY